VSSLSLLALLFLYTWLSFCIMVTLTAATIWLVYPMLDPVMFNNLITVQVLLTHLNVRLSFPPCLYYLSLNLSSLTVGYPHEQPTYYPSLQRGASSSSSLQHQAQGLGRMNTMASNVGGGGYDYAAQARAQSRQGNGGGGQYY